MTTLEAPHRPDDGFTPSIRAPEPTQMAAPKMSDKIARPMNTEERTAPEALIRNPKPEVIRIPTFPAPLRYLVKIGRRDSEEEP